MSGFQVTADELRSAAAAVREVGSRAGELAPGEALATGAAGIPGATAVKAMISVEGGWLRAVHEWQASTDRHATRLEASAATYQQAETLSVGDFSNISRALSWG